MVYLLAQLPSNSTKQRLVKAFLLTVIEKQQAILRKAFF